MNLHFAWPGLGRRGHWAARAVLLLLLSGTGNALGTQSIPSGFLAYPPYNGFAFEAVHLLPGRQDHLVVVEDDDETLNRAMGEILRTEGVLHGPGFETRQQTEERVAREKLAAVPDRLAAEFQAMKASINGDVAYAVGKDIPEAIRLYTAGAVDFHIAHPTTIQRQSGYASAAPGDASGPMDIEQRVALGKAITRFQAVLELPDAAKQPRAVTAAYMLGRSYAIRGESGDAPLAEKAFVLSRNLARAGSPDPDGLAVASFGEQARLRRAAGDLASTVGLYAEQATRGSVEGVASLKWVAQALYQDPQGMAKAENTPLAQRLLIAYALEVNDDGVVREYVYTPGRHYASVADNGSMDLILRIAKQWPKEKIAWPDRLAALAYRTGDFEYVRTLIERQDTALAWWLKAKLRVADGKLADAEAAYKHAIAKSPAIPDRDGLSPFNEGAACAEMTQLERARGEFIAALQDQIACNRTYDSFTDGRLEPYLAERVLATAELENLATAPSIKTTRLMGYDGTSLRMELAKRLVREGRYKDAITFADASMSFTLRKEDPSFDTGLSSDPKTQRDLIQAYATAREQAERGSSEVSRAAAWYHLALLTRVHHEQILDHDSDRYGESPIPAFPGVSPAEQLRLKENYKTPDQEGMRWYIAFDDALKATQLLPPRSQAYAAVLCHAAHWMHQAPNGSIGNRDPMTSLHLAWKLYRQRGAYVLWADRFGHQCADPDFEAAAKPSWIHKLNRLVARLRVHPMTFGAAFLGFFVLGGALGGWWIRRRLLSREAIS